MLSLTQWLELGTVILVCAVVVAMYNRLVALARRCDQAFADIDVTLKQRHDLVPNLVETVKGFAGHERGTLEAVMRARAAAQSTIAPESRMQAEAGLTAALGRLMVVTEAYPDLKASANFASLQDDLADLENRIAAVRRFFNGAVGEYNATVEQVPGLFVAALFGFQKRAFYEVGAEQRKALEAAAPAVRF